MGLHVWLITSKPGLTRPLHDQTDMTLGSCVLLAGGLSQRCVVSAAAPGAKFQELEPHISSTFGW